MLTPRSPRHLLGILGAAIVVCACTADGGGREAPRSDTPATSSLPTSRPRTSSPASVQRGTPETWDVPRYGSELTLREVARRGGDVEPDLLLRPVDVKMTGVGTLVADFGSGSIKSFRAADGDAVFEVGRSGHGPLELSGPPQLLGTYATPLIFQGQGGRIYRVIRDSLVSEGSAPSYRPWLSACLTGDSILLLQSTPRPRSDPFVLSTFGDVPKVLDSLPHPWPRVREVPAIARQTSLAQVDDSTCALLPLHHQEMALLTRGDTMKLGLHPETLPTAMAAIDKVTEGTRYQVARGAAYGHRGATRILGHVGVLFEGRTRHRARAIDLFSDDLRYLGSLGLPFEARAISAHADTLAVVGYENDYPLLVIYVVEQRNRTDLGAQR